VDILVEQVKALRDKTGAGMMDCKKALVESNGDFEKAIEYLRKKGAAASQKRSERIAKEGIVLAKTNQNRTEAVIVEVNCETDFVGRSDAFKQFANLVADTALNSKNNSVESLLTQKVDGLTVQQKMDETTGKVGEKVEIKRIAYYKSDDGFFCDYNHLGNKIASLIEITGKITDVGTTLGNDLAMQVVAMKPLTIDRTGINPEMVKKEQEIYLIQAKNEGKPDAIAEKIAKNKVEKFYEENCLVEQEFVKESGKTVNDVIKSVSKEAGSDYKVKNMSRFQLGETIEFNTTVS
jgi:elongation factor Ts